MALPPPVPATSISRLSAQSSSSTGLAIGSTLLFPPIKTAGEDVFWFVVVDLSSLKVVENVTSTSNSSVPASIQGYAGKTGYFLFFLTNSQGSYNLPQGALHTFLTNAGAATDLHELEQVVGQMGTGWVRQYSYILGATLTTGDLPGFEVASTQDYATLVMTFIPVNVGGTITYAPALGAVER